MDSSVELVFGGVHHVVKGRFEVVVDLNEILTRGVDVSRWKGCDVGEDGVEYVVLVVADVSVGGVGLERRVVFWRVEAAVEESFCCLGTILVVFKHVGQLHDVLGWGGLVAHS